jgi:two-component system phosphate regulon sensor histidine kinase PhoR
MQIKKTYAFAFWCACIIALFTGLVLFVANYFIRGPFEVTIVLASSFFTFIVSFFTIQWRVEKFIYSRIKKIYDEVSLFDVNELKKSTITTNMEQLSEGVKRFAEEKQFEITSLNEREIYRREFLGNVSHELKTPLFTVQGYLLTLIDGAINDTVIRKKYLNRAVKGVDRLVSIVKDLDMISRLETNEMGLNLEQFNIVELIQEVFDLLEMKAKTRGITLSFNKKYDAPVLVIGDLEKIEQVLTNLIVNSLKYGRVGGSTIISVESHGQQKILVKVIDDGEGIKKLHLSRLFERFYRVDQSRSREQGGSGLGLSIVKHIVEAHDETILVKSEFGEGSEFSFTLKKVK